MYHRHRKHNKKKESDQEKINKIKRNQSKKQIKKKIFRIHTHTNKVIQIAICDERKRKYRKKEMKGNKHAHTK